MEFSENVFHLSAHFSGHVQGVGFRYATKQLAKGFDVTGYVRNLADGRVELEAEGTEGECRRFLSEIESELDSYIRKTECRTGKRARLYKEFSIK
jgi:acylphosphatase